MRLLTNIPFVPDYALNYEVEFFIYSQKPSSDTNCLYWDPCVGFLDFFNSIQQHYHFDALFIHLAELSELPLGLENFPLPIIASVSDWNLYYFKLRHTLDYFDLILCDQRGVQLLTYLGYNARYWCFYGYIPARFLPAPAEKSYDIVFAGNFNTYFQRDRASWLTRLARLSEKYKVKIDTCVFGFEYTKLLQSAKIVFNRSIRGEANMRVFESLAAESLILLEEENLEIQSYFQNGKECILYNNENFEAIIDSLLQTPKVLDKITQNACCKKHIHTKHHSLIKLKEIIEETCQSPDWKKRKSSGFTVQQHLSTNFISRVLSRHRFSSKHTDSKILEALLKQDPTTPLLLWYYALLSVNIAENQKNSFFNEAKKAYYTQCENSSDTSSTWTHFNFLLILQRLNIQQCKREQLLERLNQQMENQGSLEFNRAGSLPACISDEPFMMELNYHSWPLEQAPFSNDSGHSLLAILKHWIAFHQGKEFLLQNQLDMAERYFTRANNYFSKNSDCLFLLALVENQKNKWQSALIHIQEAWNLDPLNHHYWPLRETLLSNHQPDVLKSQKRTFSLLQKVSKKMWT